MEIFVWLYQMTIPLLGWWLLISQFQKFAVRLQNKWDLQGDFRTSFVKSLVLAFVNATPEQHLKTLKEKPLSLRVQLLGLGLRSLSYGFIFIVLFGIWNWIPTPVVLLLGLVLFVIAQRWKSAWGFALLALGLGLFLFGYENLMHATSRLTGDVENSAWVYSLSANFWPGALLGTALGAIFHLLFRLSGVAWWSGLNLLLSGILSLGGAWGFFLGEFLMTAIEDLIRFKDRDFRLRSSLALGFGLFVLLLSAPFQSFVMSWINGQYSVELRALQLGAMIFIFLLLESVVSLGFFHFYYLKRQKT